MICSLFKIHGLMALWIEEIVIVPELTNWIIRNEFNSSYIIKSIIHNDAICEHHRWHMVSFPSFILQIKNNDFSIYPYTCKNKNKRDCEYNLFSSYIKKTLIFQSLHLPTWIYRDISILWNMHVPIQAYAQLYWLVHMNSLKINSFRGFFFY